MYVCMYVAHTYLCVSVHMCNSASAHMCVHLNIHMYVHIHVYMHLSYTITYVAHKVTFLVEDAKYVSEGFVFLKYIHE